MTHQDYAALLLLLPGIPLLLAATSVLFRVRGYHRVLLLGWPVLQVAAACWLLAVQFGGGLPVLGHNTGGYTSGVAIAFVADPINTLLLAVTGVATFITACFLILSREAEYRFAPALILMLTAGVNGALLTADLFNLFVFIEVMLLPSYALIAITGGFARLAVGRMFVILNLVTSTILVIGVGLVYGVAGTVNLPQLTGQASTNPVLAAAVAVVLLALAIKAGAVPVHGWLPNSYPGTSGGMMALFSALHTKVGVYAALRVYFVCFQTPADYQWVLTLVVLASMLLPALLSLGQAYARSVLAYQMVSGVGNIFLAAVVFSTAAVAASFFYLIHHIMTMGALLLCVAAIEKYYGVLRLKNFAGFLKQEPVAAGIMALALLSLAGLPPTSGVWGKIGLLQALAAHPWGGWLITAVLVASLASLLALMRLFQRVFFGRLSERHQHQPRKQIPFRLLAPAAAFLSISVLLFVFAAPLQNLVADAAEVFTNPWLYAESVLEGR